MDLLRYRKVDAGQVATGLAKELDLDWSKRDKIEEYLRYRYTIVEFQKKGKSNPLFRLTGPLYLLFFLMLLIGIPVKWLFTGSAYYTNESRLLKVRKSWADKLNF